LGKTLAFAVFYYWSFSRPESCLRFIHRNYSGKFLVIIS